MLKPQCPSGVRVRIASGALKIKAMIIHKALWNSKMTTMLVVLLIASGIGFFTKGANNTPIVFLPAAYLLFSARDKYVFMSRLKEDYPDAAVGMGVSPEFNFPKTLFSKIINTLILAGFISTIVFFCIKFIW